MKLLSQPYGIQSRVCSGLVCKIFQRSSNSILPPLEFIHGNPHLVSPDNAMAFLSDDGGETYNRCHCEFSEITVHAYRINVVL